MRRRRPVASVAQARFAPAGRLLDFRENGWAIPARDIALTPVVPAPPAPAPVAEAAPPPNTDDPNAKEVDTQE